MNEFKINEFITLKLENEETNIYIKDQLFNQCKNLLLNIPAENVSSLNEIKSIDEAAEKLGWTEDGQMGITEGYSITPETEFWAHCSNLQLWVESNYNSNLIHSNLAFPLLKELVEVADPITKRVFKEEIAKKFLSCICIIGSCSTLGE